MSSEAGPPENGDSLDAALDAELARVLEAYLADLEAGRPVDPDRLLAEHAELAEQLRSCLAVVNLADRVADGSATSPGPAAPRRDAVASLSGQSALANLGLGADAIPRVHLRDVPDEREPLVRPRGDAMPLVPQTGFARYQLQGEIARGGMGAVLKGRDVDLGRDLAIKVLLESHKGDPDVVRRFVEEAQIGGQLQHPGIVPVFELGTIADRRPYFAMKLVKGRTLAALLSERGCVSAPSPAARTPGADATGLAWGAGRGSPDTRGERGCVSAPSTPGTTPGADATGLASDLPRFLSIFEQVCQTMAYAHARGVIHRDLKPSNIMVGSFGEVQVMDWGLAKVLHEGGVADEARARPAHETVIMTVRSGSAGSGGESQAGSVLGTPAYMAPEQARGEIERIDERADVFGLGAILCEILTGGPPFAGATREETCAQSARGDLGDALARLAACGAEAELIDLARDCVAPERARRPRNAGQVSGRMTAFLTGLQERLRSAELARAAEQARAEEAQATAAAAEARARAERQARRLTVALAASVLVVVGLLGGGSTYLARQRMARLAATSRAVTEALAEAERLRGQAEAAADDNQVKWFEAVVAARRARDLLAEGEADQALRQQVNDVLVGLVREQAAAAKQAAEVERDQKLLGELEAIRGNRGEHLDPKQTDIDYAAAFRAFGIDLDQLAPEEAGKQIARRSAPAELASYLDDWAVQRRNARDKKDEGSWRRLLAAARAADPDPWRVALRDQIGRGDLDSLRRLSASENELAAQSAPSLVLLAGALTGRGDRALAERVLQRAWRIKPGDFWVNHDLGVVQWTGSSLGRPEEAVRYLSAAVAIRPRSSPAHSDLGVALQKQGKPDEAIAELRTAIRLKPDHAGAHNNLGLALKDQGKLDEAIAEFRTAIRLKPDHVDARISLGAILADVRHDHAGAITEFRAAIRVEPDSAAAHNNLGNALREEGKLDEAVAEYREAIRLKPDYPEAHNGLGIALKHRGNPEEGIAEYRAAIRLNPQYSEAHTSLGAALIDEGKLNEAVAECREALRLTPDFFLAHTNLGNALRQQGKLDEAIAQYHTAIRLKPDHPLAHNNLGSALMAQGKLKQAVAELREAIRLKADFAAAHNNLAMALEDQGKLEEAVAEWQAAIRLKPDIAKIRYNFGNVLLRQGKLEEAIAEYREAIRLKPDSADEHDNLGNALKDQAKLEEAVAEYREAIRLKPDHANAHNNLGGALHDQGKLQEAVAEYREAIRLKPDHAAAHYNFGLALRSRDEFADAIDEFRKARDLAKSNAALARQIKQDLIATEQQALMAARLPAVLSGKLRPSSAAESLGFAQLCYARNLHGSSARLWTEAFQAEPKLTNDMQAQNRYNAACAAALAGSGQGKDDPPLDEPTKARWQKQAIEWLKADLAAWSKVLEKAPPAARQSISQTLQHWKADPDLAGLRDATSLAKLPEAEQKACRALWAEVEALLKKAQDAKP
ncbi:MAG: tetratricopeptide repeat protein [Isosphaeraceae bacterium]